MDEISQVIDIQSFCTVSIAQKTEPLKGSRSIFGEELLKLVPLDERTRAIDIFKVRNEAIRCHSISKNGEFFTKIRKWPLEKFVGHFLALRK